MTARRTLPPRRSSRTFELYHAAKQFTVSVGYFDPMCTQPAEVFVNGAKVGSDVEAVARDAAVLLSIALQYGVPLETMAGAATRGRDGEPMTIIGAVLDKLFIG
jgi:hypothetical protein